MPRFASHEAACLQRYPRTIRLPIAKLRYRIDRYDVGDYHDAVQKQHCFCWIRVGRRKIGALEFSAYDAAGCADNDHFARVMDCDSEFESRFATALCSAWDDVPQIGAMTRFSGLLHREPCEIQIQSLRFIREHDGKPERVLKDRLVESFKQRADVERAYLAQVSSASQVGVALCLKTRNGPDPSLVREIAVIFAAIFVRQEHLDILFLEESQESALGSVCTPFYAAPAPAH
jgi:SseB protein C-terminal domain